MGGFDPPREHGSGRSLHRWGREGTVMDMSTHHTEATMTATHLAALRARLGAVEVAPPAQPYYDRQHLYAALSDGLTRVEEWDYAQDAHGYCHERPDWLALVAAVVALLDDAEVSS